MKRVELNFRQRLLLSDALGNQRGLALADMMTCFQLLEKLQFTPAESKAVGLQLKTEGARAAYVWDPTAKLSDFGKVVELENDEARRLKTVIDTHTGWMVPDAPVINEVKQQLDGSAPVNPAKSGRRNGPKGNAVN